MPRFAFEDFPPGHQLDYGAYHVTQDEIVAFAREFDPQPFHVDEEAAKQTLLGGLAASGWHTAAMLMRMTCDGWMLDSTAMGAPGIEEIKWLKPVRPADDLRVHAEVLDARVSRSRPDMGLVLVEMQVINQTGEIVMTQRNYCMFGRRDAPLAAQRIEAAGAPQRVNAPPPPVPAAEDSPPPSGWYEDVTLGTALGLGSYEFRREDMLRFARAYDPQPFHLDDAAAAQSHFGALVASGWHTAAAYMQRRNATRQRQRAEAIGRGENPPQNGPALGIRGLRWRRPVHAGDLLTYMTTPVEKRPSSRPGWGLVTSFSEGTNQHGVKVIDYRATILMPMRG